MAEGNKSSNEKTKAADSSNPNKEDLMSSAKLLAGAAKSTITHDGNTVDKAQVANATGDILSAAKEYGHLEDKSYGKYIDKAEDYLHHYHSTKSPTAEGKSDQSQSAGEEGAQAQSTAGGGGPGEYLNMAEGLLKKN